MAVKTRERTGTSRRKATFYVMDSESAIVSHEDCYTTNEICAALSDALNPELGVESP